MGARKYAETSRNALVKRARCKDAKSLKRDSKHKLWRVVKGRVAPLAGLPLTAPPFVHCVRRIVDRSAHTERATRFVARVAETTDRRRTERVQSAPKAELKKRHSKSDNFVSCCFFILPLALCDALRRDKKPIKQTLSIRRACLFAYTQRRALLGLQGF